MRQRYFQTNHHGGSGFQPRYGSMASSITDSDPEMMIAADSGFWLSRTLGANTH